MIFKDWLFLNEDVESNFDHWVEVLKKYAKPEDEAQNFVLDTIVESFKNIIVQVLKEKNLENLNWFSFCVGYLSVKHFRKEDLELAIDVTKNMISSGEITKPEIGSKGWYRIGVEAKSHVESYLISSQSLSNRRMLKMKKTGESINEKDYIELKAQEGDLKLYKLRGLSGPTDIDLVQEEGPEDLEKEIKERKLVLCKYGKGTKWCTANPSGNYDRYYAHNNIFIVIKDNKPMFQFVSCLDVDKQNHQFMNTEDNEIRDLPDDIYDFLEKYAKQDVKCYNLKVSFIASSGKEHLATLNKFLKRENLKNINWYSLIKLLETEYRNYANRIDIDMQDKIIDKMLKYYKKEKNYFENLLRPSYNKLNDLNSLSNQFLVILNYLPGGGRWDEANNYLQDEEKSQRNKLHNWNTY